jgi:signal transduction histidine kinase
MRKVPLRTIALVLASSLALLSLTACAALKLVTDVMAARAEAIVVAAHQGDQGAIVRLMMRIESWSRTGDYIAWGIGALVVVGTVLGVIGMYVLVFFPLFDLARAMRRFTAGDREARATRGRGRELATTADNFNEMADIITGQHKRMVQFLAEAQMELRDPVQVMRVALAVFTPDKRFPPEPLARSRIAVVSREVDRLERLLTAYLDETRVQWRRLDLQVGLQDLSAIVRDIATMYQAFSPVHQVEVCVPQHPMPIYTNPPRLAQVFHTLVANAIQRSRDGGVIQVVGRTDERERAEGVIEVIDHGVAIPEEDLARIFEPFQRITTERQTGPRSSVALSTTRRIVQALGGRIEVRSKAHEGSTFTVRLPLAMEPVAGANGDGEPARPGDGARPHGEVEPPERPQRRREQPAGPPPRGEPRPETGRDGGGQRQASHAGTRH